MGKILKQSHYNRVPERVFGVIVCSILVSLPIIDLLLGENKRLDTTYIGGIIFFGVCLLVYLWQLFTKKPQIHYVNINGWKYRSFQKMSKWKFIFISGFVYSIRYSIMIAILFFSNLIKNDLSPLEIILNIIGLCVISAVPYGLINYKKCAGVNMNFDLKHPL